MLFVDLDNSLIKTDYLAESFFNYFSDNIFAPFTCAAIFLKKGKVGLKKFLYKNSNISITNLPYNQDVLKTIQDYKKKFPDQKVYLISATYFEAVNEISNYLGCFDGAFGTNAENLKSMVKLKKINEISDQKPFIYIGDSKDDVVIWKNSKKCILVNPSRRLQTTVKNINNSVDIIKSSNSFFLKEVIKALRIHQWVKNLLLFIPLLLSLKPFYDLYGNLINGFFAFSFIASAFYILNDLFDIENDRTHYSKKYTPFAGGSLSILHALLIFCLLIIFHLLFL